MTTRSLIAAAAVCAILGALLIAVFAYDATQADQIADGVRVAGVDVGGMSKGEAGRVLQARLAEPLQRPLRVRALGRRFVLSASEARVRTDVGALVQQALDKSRGGNAFSRTWRAITGGKVEARIRPRLRYSRAAVASLVHRIEQTVDRAPQDATVQASASGLQKVPSHNGVAVRAQLLRRRIGAALTDLTARRNIRAPTRALYPSVTTDELADRYPVFLIVNRGGFRLSLYKHLQLAKSYPIAVGRVGLETPAGLYHIEDKQVNPSWHVPNSSWAGALAGKVIPPGPQDPLKARWMGFYDGAGIHGTADIGSLGTAASHGCIRMSIPDVVELYTQVPMGTPVYVA